MTSDVNRLGILFLSCLCSLPISTSLGAPKLLCTDESFDFGSAKDSATIEHVFQLKNDGDEELIISSVKTSCGCTATELSAKTLAPGSEASLTVKVSLLGLHGQISKAAVISSNDKARPEQSVTVKGEVKVWAEISAQQVKFDRIYDPKDTSQTVQITVDKDESTTITGAECVSDKIEASIAKTRDARKFELIVRLRDPKSVDAFQTIVRVHTNSPDRVLLVGVNVLGLHDVSLMPEEVVLINRSGDPIVRDIMVLPSAAKKFGIISVLPPVKSIESQVTALGNGGFRIRLSNIIPNEDLNGKKIIITTDIPGAEPLTVPIGVVNPEVTIDPGTDSVVQNKGNCLPSRP